MIPWANQKLNLLLTFTFYYRYVSLFGPRCNKTYLGGFPQCDTQTSQLIYRDWLVNWNFNCSKLRYDTITKALIRMYALDGLCRCCFQTPKTGFLILDPFLLAFCPTVYVCSIEHALWPLSGKMICLCFVIKHARALFQKKRSLRKRESLLL